jgi:hypothetical protein
MYFKKKIHEKLIQKMWCIEKIICIFSNILQKNSFQNLFYEIVKMTTKITASLESFITIGLFDYDRTLL